MMSGETDDATSWRLRPLRVHEPDAARAARVHARCRTMMARRQKADEAARSRDFTALMLDPAVLASLCASYLFAMIFDLFRLYNHR